MAVNRQCSSAPCCFGSLWRNPYLIYIVGFYYRPAGLPLSSHLLNGVRLLFVPISGTFDRVPSEP